MRDLTPEECEFIAGGLATHRALSSEYDPPEIVVVHSPPPYFPPPFFPPPYSPPPYFPPPPTGGGGGGGGGEPTPPPPSTPITVTADPTHHTATISAQLPGVNGTINFNLSDWNLQTISLDLHNGSNTLTTSINLTNGMIGETYTVNLGGSSSASISFATNGSNSAINASVTYRF